MRNVSFSHSVVVCRHSYCRKASRAPATSTRETKEGCRWLLCQEDEVPSHGTMGFDMNARKRACLTSGKCSPTQGRLTLKQQGVVVWLRRYSRFVEDLASEGTDDIHPPEGASTSQASSQQEYFPLTHFLSPFVDPWPSIVVRIPSPKLLASQRRHSLTCPTFASARSE
ncbi:hypothetical protein M0802_009487 [Mischocyttarus mexicanus]|nr:hypothetical protein M0802_009487 [Mischocyttarus mexicanus]